MNEYVIEEGTKLRNEKNEIVEVYGIKLELFMGGWKTIIITKDKDKFLNEYFIGDLDRRIFRIENDKNDK